MNKKTRKKRLSGKLRGSDFQLNLFHLVLSSLVINLLALAMPIMMLQAYDRILPNYSMGTLSILIFGVLTAIGLEMLLRIARSYLTAWSGAVFEHETSCAAMQQLLSSSTEHFEKQGSGAYLQKMAAISRLRGFYSGQALLTIVDLPFIFIFLFLIGYIAGDLVLVPLILFLLFCFLAWFVGFELRKQVQELDLKLKELLGKYLESTYRLHNINNSVKLSSDHVAKIQKGYELRDQTKLQLLRAEANLKDLETRVDIDEQDKETAFRDLLDFSGLEKDASIFAELENLLQDEVTTAGCINTLAAVQDNLPRLESYIRQENADVLFNYYKVNSLFYKNIVLEKLLAHTQAQRFTQDEWFDISLRGNYDRREDTSFSDYEGEGTLSLTLSVPLFTGGTIFSNKKSKASALQIAKTRERADLRARFHSIQNNKKSIDALLNVLNKQQVNLQQQQEIVVLSLKSYQIKQTSMQDLLTSQNKLIDIKNDLMQTTNQLGVLFRQFAFELGTPFPPPQS